MMRNLKRMRQMTNEQIDMILDANQKGWLVATWERLPVSWKGLAVLMAILVLVLILHFVFGYLGISFNPQDLLLNRSG